MKSKRLKLFHGSILIALLSVNSWIFINRDKGFAYTEILNYNQLYNVNETLSIQSIEFNGTDSINITLYPQSNQSEWNIQYDSGDTYTNLRNLRFKLQEGKHIYRMSNVEDSRQNFEIGLNYVGTKTYAKSGRKRASDVEFLFCSIPLFNEQIPSKDFWMQSSALTTEEDIKDVNSILQNELKIQRKDSAIQKIKKIGVYLLKNLQSKTGTPNDKMTPLSPVQKMNEALKNNSKIWCGDFAEIFALYANEAGITTRLVCTEGDANGIPKSGHSINECYISELNQWVFVDLTSGILLVQNHQGKYLNGIDFYRAHLLNSSDMILTQFSNDSLRNNPFNYEKSFYRDYFNKETYFLFYKASQFSKDFYAFTNKWSRYFFKRASFAIYSDSSQTDNKKFYLKQFAALGFLGFLAYLLIFSLINRLRKK